MRYILGVDGGNTKTVALLARPDGRIAGAGRGGCGDIYGGGLAEVALSSIEEAVAGALREAGARAETVETGVFSLAGADWPEDFDFIGTELRQRPFGASVIVVNDAVGALRAGSPDGTGVVVVCGTGAAIGARSASGAMWHTSFWQEPQGSRHLGNKTLRAVYRAELGIDPPTALTARVLQFFGQPGVEDDLHLFTARLGRRPSNVGGLARVVMDEAERGDATAHRIVEEHGSALGDYALAAARRVGIERRPFTLVLAGGVLRHPAPLLGAALVARVRTASPEVRVVNSRFEPAVGALLLALEAAGVAVDDQLIARMLPTLPPASLFAT
jgi:N-acetylglucosamine kinase-like BadF-type ATPase